MSSFFARIAAIALIVAALLIAVACQNPTGSSNNDSNSGGSSGDNGSAEPGASLAADINPGGSSNPAQLTVYNGALYFSANDGTSGTELWRYDGVSAGLVEEINPSGGSDPRFLTVYGNRLYFSAVYETSVLRGLFRYGETGVEQIDGVQAPGYLTPYAGSLYMYAREEATGTELWRLNDSSAELAADINEGSANSDPQFLTVYNNNLYFQANDGVIGFELFRFDGETAQPVYDIREGGNAFPQRLIVYNGQLYFRANDGSGIGLWRYNGSDPPVEVTTAETPHNSDMIVYDEALYFAATLGPVSSSGNQLWRYDGSIVSQVTFLGSDDPNHNGIAIPAQMAEYEGALYFAGDDGSGSGVELYRYDGQTVELAADINPAESSNPKNFAVYDGKLYFQADDGDSGAELWVYH